MAPTRTLVLALIWRIDRPAERRKQSNSRTFRVVVLLTGMGSPKKAEEPTEYIDKTMRWEYFLFNVNTNSESMNSNPGKTGKVFTLNWIESSLSLMRLQGLLSTVTGGLIYSSIRVVSQF